MEWGTQPGELVVYIVAFMNDLGWHREYGNLRYGQSIVASAQPDESSAFARAASWWADRLETTDQVADAMESMREKSHYEHSWIDSEGRDCNLRMEIERTSITLR